MLSYALIALYVIFAVGGSTLIKYGGIAKVATLITIPLIHIQASLITLAGIVLYGLSFLFYVILLNKFDLSFISPITIGLVYVFLMVTAIVVFNEQFTLLKTIGCVLILVGVLLVIITNNKAV
jgi:drug/metabolite transporter (DMT)-like permease